MNKFEILVTGAAGFIGFHLCRKLLRENKSIIGIDNINNYYDPELKYARLNQLNTYAENSSKKWIFHKANLEDIETLQGIFSEYRPKIVINLAAQAGVRYSLENPLAYINSNILGFVNLLECCKNFPVENFLYASSSSVYGGNTKIPFEEINAVDHPVSLYAATKKSNELIAHTYSHLYKIPSTGLRLFTVYGPWGRPDMAPMIFAKAILSSEPIKIFNDGDMKRDFTYIDDVIEIIFRLLENPAKPESKFNTNFPDSSQSWSPYKIYNIGNGNPTSIMEFINKLERELGKKANKKYEPMQKGDVKETFSDSTKIKSLTGYDHYKSLDYGITKFVKWYKGFYGYN